MSHGAFREKIREKIADRELQGALDANSERRVQARVSALAALPDWRERRQRAHAVRAEMIKHLDDYLERFCAKVSANGIQVHFAREAGEAAQMVLEIARAAKPGGEPALFAKSKSMLSEEIGLNKALEAAGHSVMETDLGEYIVQLRGEPPAHLITPAVHLRRRQVGELFHEKLGIPFTEDIPTLTSTARKVLRDVFLKADIGLTGVNFGIAESGTLVLVTNEGNGRMCATLPPVHIALMGMERILPGMDDLALMLSLLPRSATGQKLSVYTQLIQAPEAGQKKHLVIVDNGRSALRNSPLSEALYCIRCGSCLNACPVFREIGGHAYVGQDGTHAPYPGPIGAVISPGLLGENFSNLAQASTLCGACKDACPVDIDLPKLLLRVRAGKLPFGGSPKAGNRDAISLGLAAYSKMAAHPRVFAAGQKMVGWFSRPLPRFIPLPAASGWGLSKDLPKPAPRPFREIYLPASDIRESIPASSVDGPVFSRQPTGEQPAQMENLSAGEPAAIFEKELKALGGRVYRVKEAELLDNLIGFLHERGLKSLQMWENVQGIALGELEAAGFRVSQTVSPGQQAGITGALAGIAETGSLVVAGGDGKPLTASLVPPVHIAVLRVEQIHSSLEQALRLLEVTGSLASVLVSGPSRTADIEMTLTIGMHGPGELHVFLVDGMKGK